MFFALSCAPDLQTGFERFARFKHVFGPLGIWVRTDAAAMIVRLVPLRPDGGLPASVAAPILTFLHEKSLSCTASCLVPLAVYRPMPHADLADVFGVTPSAGEPALVYAENDTRRRLVYVCERFSKSRSGLLRDLQGAGVSFKDSLTDTGKTMALRYPRTSDMPIKQIANLLAYQDANAFHRAFKSWTGESPVGGKVGTKTPQSRASGGSQPGQARSCI